MDVLDELTQAAWRRVEEGYYRASGGRVRPCSSLAGALRENWARAIIAEIKPRSPTHPDLLRGRDVLELARAYSACGAAGISVLTDPDHFGGSLKNLRVLSGLGLPLLAKDFVVDPCQLSAYQACGADCVLLIMALFSRKGTSLPLAEMIRRAHSLGLEVLLEVSSEEELKAALDSQADLIGINSRDLSTMEVDAGRPIRVLQGVSPAGGRPFLALSGISSPGEIRRLREAGFAGFLVGTSLLLSPDLGAKLREFTGA